MMEFIIVVFIWATLTAVEAYDHRHNIDRWGDE
jgi:hypothetical protein